VSAPPAGPRRRQRARRRRRWVIDVCRTCGRLATWPFCEHRPDGYRSAIEGEEPWCEAVAVEEVRR
jgi:hypothetical protein